MTGTATMTAGGTNELTITAKDAYGNVDTYYAGSTLYFSGPGTAPGGQVPTVENTDVGLATAVAFTNGVSNAGAATLIAYRAQSTTVDVSDGSIDSSGNTAYDLDLTVGAAAAATLDLTPEGGSTTAGAAFSVIVTAYDSYGNPATGYTGVVHFTSTDGSATLPGDYTFSSSSHTFTNGVTLFTSGTRNVTVTDLGNGSLTDTETWSVSAAAAATLDLTPEGGSTTAGAAFSVIVTAYDSYGNPATGYTGIVHFTSTDGSATLPWRLHLQLQFPHLHQRRHPVHLRQPDSHRHRHWERLPDRHRNVDRHCRLCQLYHHLARHGHHHRWFDPDLHCGSL